MPAAHQQSQPRARLSLGRGGTVKVDKQGRFKVKAAQIECPPESTGACTVKIGVTAPAPPKKKHGKGGRAKAILQLGTSTLTVSAGKTATLQGKLSKAGLGKLKQAKHLSSKITVAASVPGGETAKGGLSAKLLAPPSHHG